jgi:hypothetical protein
LPLTAIFVRVALEPADNILGCKTLESHVLCSLGHLVRTKLCVGPKRVQPVYLTVFEPMFCLDSDTGWQWTDWNASMKLESFRDFFGLRPSSRTSITRFSSEANEACRWNGRRIVMHCDSCKDSFECLTNSETDVKCLFQGVGQLH